jgi:hypothetical protein
MKPFKLLSTIIIACIFSLSILGQTGINPPEGIKKNLNLSSGQSPTIGDINDAYYAIPDSINGEVNKEYIKSQRWFRYVFSKYNIYDSVTFDLTPYSQAVKAIYNSPLHCTSSDDANWTSEGPRYMPDGGFGQGGGWTNSIYGDPDDTTRMLIGTNTSGIFKTEDEDSTWVNVTDNMDYPVLGVNQIIPSPDNEDYLLATTGTLFIQGGLIYSNDRGDSWNSFTTETPFFNWIDFHPTIDGLVFGTAEDDVYYSDNYGQTWTSLSAPTLPSKIEFNKIIAFQNKLFVTTFAHFSQDAILFKADLTLTPSISANWTDIILDFVTVDDTLYFADFSNKVGERFYLQLQTRDNNVKKNKIFKSIDAGDNFIETSINIHSVGGRRLKNELIASVNDTNIVY